MWGISLLVFLFSLSVQKAVLDCGTVANEFPSPNISTKTEKVMKGQNVSVFCFNANQSLTITYSLFRNKTYLGTQDGKGEPTVFNQSILGIKDLGPYKCKAQVLNCSKYSQEFNFTFVETLPGGDSCPFCLPLLLPGLLLVLMVIILILAFWILRKYKARGATGDSVPKDDGETTKEVGIYVNIHTGQPGTEPSQEIHYATPTFQKVAPAQQEACNNCNTGYVYSELIF